jgi:type IV pilus assembly protein PilY1
MNQLLKLTLGTLSVAAALVSQAVTLSQSPLLTQGGQITPNLMLIFDDSGSMDRQYLYQYGGTPGGYGYPGPGTGGTQAASCPTGLNLNVTCNYTPVNIVLGTPPTASGTVTYDAWLNSVSYSKGADVTYGGLNYECTARSGCPAVSSGGGSTTGNWETRTRSTWDNDEGYDRREVVKSAIDGKYYQCIRSDGCPRSSTDPSAYPTRWQLVPTWVSTTTYSENNYVVHPTTGQLYKCDKEPCGALVASGGSGTYTTTPPDTSSLWDVISAGGGSGGTSSAGAFWAVSPDVNRIYYDPRVRYKVRLTSTAGVPTTTPLPVTSPFYVFLYKNYAGNPAVWGGGMPTSSPAEPDPKAEGSYFSPYTVSNAALLATGATTGLKYPVCVGDTCPAAVADRNGPFPKFTARTDCAGSSCTLLEEQQNFAIWKKFHSNRLDLAKTGLGYAFENMVGTLRLGWGSISELGNGAPNATLGTGGSGVGLLTQARKDLFYTWLYSQDATSSTPLRKSLITIGEYYKRADANGPWASDANLDPNSKNVVVAGTVSTHATCRRSYAMMTTDGYYNDSSLAVGNVDSTAITAITGQTPSGGAITFNYNGATKPYAEPTSNTLADVAMKYWITDLRTDLVNNVPTTPNNPSFWQNMGFYGVGLGIYGTIPQTQATLDQITNNTRQWPVPPSGGNDARTIDDMWHATVNARGRFLSAQNADALSDGVEGMLAEINRIEASQSGVAASTLSLTTTTKKFTPNYTTGSWIGNVIASDLEPKSGAELCTRWRLTGTWMLEPNPAPSTTAKMRWHVANKWDGTPDLPPCTGTPTTYSGVTYSGRKIYAWDGSAFGNFDSSNSHVTSSTTGVASGNLPSGLPASADLVNYLRGDQSKEDIVDARGFVETPRSYRNRQFILGDIVNSTPTFIQGALNMNYEKLPSDTNGQASYAAFFKNKGDRAEGVLFAGANDGMVHGFRGTTGAEVFAFVPRAVMPNMYRLASRSYDHQYYVDGTTVEADACLPQGTNCTAAQWKNLLVGTGGAGAKTVYALDVTDPMSMTAASIKWEITPSTTGYPDLGNILGDVQTGITVGGQWVAVFGNGYKGSDGKAHLYVANLDTGAMIRDFPVGTASDNGLGGVRLLRDDNQRIIAAYAGDLNGSLWKFDLSNASAGSWGVGLSGQPLFKTLLTPVKPITATPTVVKHPLNGYVVAFGTGKLFESGSTDLSNTDVQSLYGVWDSVTPPAITQVDRTSLVQQTISAAITGSTVFTNTDLSTSTVALSYYEVSKNPINWATKTGWYIDLPNTGQRVIYPLETLVGKFAAVDTVSPANISTNPCLTAGSGKAWNYIIDMVTGGGVTEKIFDNNGGINLTTLVSGYENAADGRTRYIKNEALSTMTSVGFTPLSTQQLPSFGLSCTMTNTCATKPIVKRTWRQLFMR